MDLLSLLSSRVSNTGNVQQSVNLESVQVSGLGFSQNFKGSQKELTLYPEDSGNLVPDAQILVPWYAIGPMNFKASVVHGYNDLSNKDQANGSITNHSNLDGYSLDLWICLLVNKKAKNWNFYKSKKRKMIILKYHHR